MDGLCLKPGPSVRGISSPNVGSDIRTHPVHVSALGRDAGVTTPSPSSSSFLRSSFTAPLTSLGDPSIDMRNEDDEEGEEEEGEELNDENAPPLPEKKRRGNWVLKILHIGTLWSKQRKGSDEDKEEEEVVGGDHSRCFYCCDGEEEESDGCGIGDELEEIEFDRDSFSRLLTRVSLMEARVYAKMSDLGCLAYVIPKIKSRNLLEYRGLCFVTSSFEKKAQLLTVEKEQISSPDKEAEPFVSKKEKLPAQETEDAAEEGKKQRANGHRISVSSVYQIAAAAAAAASYLHSHTRSILSFKSARTNVKDDSVEGGDHCLGDTEISNSKVASLVATTNSVTAVVAGKEEMKQAVANDLSSAHSSPCEWFICDDKSSGTRFFVIQGSESLASWQANLLFEPIQFEGLDVLVHRGIYEAAKGMYEQLLPEVRAHLKSHGNSATLRFTGHSLGGSLALLVNLMLLIRGEAPRSSLLPVITFGSPSIMCGGNHLLRKLGLPQSHVQAITIHRDIVPRAFSCSYPDHVAELLKAMNRNFRNHPCLNNQKLLYAPMGKLLILQPEENLSPHHHLLPSGSGLYLLGHPVSDSGDLVKLIRAAQTAFLNSPHPLEILSDPSAYGSDGAIYRDHDVNSYMRAVRAVIRQELKHLRKTKREQRRKAWWPLVPSQGLHTSVIVDRRAETANLVLHQHPFSTVFQSGRESLKWFSRLVASQHVHLLIVLLFPARLLLLGTLAIVGFH